MNFVILIMYSLYKRFIVKEFDIKIVVTIDDTLHRYAYLLR